MVEQKNKAKGGKKNRKVGRNARRCEAYKAENRRERNKLVRLLRHLARFPKDVCAKHAIARVQNVLRVRLAA